LPALARHWRHQDRHKRASAQTGRRIARIVAPLVISANNPNRIPGEIMDDIHSPVYILNSHAEAKAAIGILGKSGVDVGKLSLVNGLSALGSALASAGISGSQAGDYETALKANKYLLMVRGNAEDLATVNAVLASSTGLENP
jgi:hypothetical protein